LINVKKFIQSHAFDFQILSVETITPNPVPVIQYNPKTKQKEFLFDEDGSQLFEEQDPVLIVHGRLTVPNLGSREHIGWCVLQETSEAWGKAYVVAVFNCLENCIVLFTDEQYEETQKNQVQKTEPETEPVVSEDWNEEDLEAIRVMMEVMGMEDFEELTSFIQDFSDGQLNSIDDITPENIKAFRAYLEKIVEEGEVVEGA